MLLLNSYCDFRVAEPSMQHGISVLIHFWLKMTMFSLMVMLLLLELLFRPTGWWPGVIMSPCGWMSGLDPSDTHLSVLGSFGCHWTLTGCSGLLHRAPRGATGNDASMHSSFPKPRFTQMLRKQLCKSKATNLTLLRRSCLFARLTYHLADPGGKLGERRSGEGEQTRFRFPLIPESYFPFSCVRLKFNLKLDFTWVTRKEK